MEKVLKTFRMQHAGTCTGMYWRGDPRLGRKTWGEPPEWPRNGAVLRGTVHSFDSKPEDSELWLEVADYKQAGSDVWVPTPNCWMQFDQHGPLLHEI